MQRKRERWPTRMSRAPYEFKLRLGDVRAEVETNQLDETLGRCRARDAFGF
jgi:hypothetical protein